MDAVLAISHLNTAFLTESRWHPVVHDVSIEVHPGETVAVVGESGSGKSVTALSVLRLLPFRSTKIEGSIRFNGRELLNLSEAEMRKIRGNEIAMIFQEPMTSLNPVMTVGAQISEVLMLHRRHLSRDEAASETVRLLDKVRIPSAKSRFYEHPHSLSGGMRQRVMIAMALACRPRLLIADEPTTALDVTIQAQILDLIKSLQQEDNMSVLFITHDMGVVAEIADRTVVMYGGRAVETAPTGRIFSGPKDPYTRALLAAVPKLGSMGGQSRPMRFPIVDRATGTTAPPTEVSDTVVFDGHPVLQVSNLTTRFAIRSKLTGRIKKRVHAVENVSFSLKAGETLALVGESGCGKSTTGRSLLRLVEPANGEVLLEGKDLLRLGAAELRGRRQSMQMIFQDPFASLNPRRTVGSAIAEPLLLNGTASSSQARAAVGELLEKVGLQSDMAHRYPHEFSGGQRQRICIARALSVEPKVIVADESVAALDVSVKAQIINLMLDLQEKMKLAYLFISHDMSVVERMCHRVAVMYLGEIVEIGSREAIFGNPQHPYTKRLLAAVPVPDPTVKSRRRQFDPAELKSPIRDSDYVPPVRTYLEMGTDHLVMAWGGEWEQLSSV